VRLADILPNFLRQISVIIDHIVSRRGWYKLIYSPPYIIGYAPLFWSQLMVGGEIINIVIHYRFEREMVAKKSKSKRQSLQQKYKIKKRTKEHHKRLKKGRLNLEGKRKKNEDQFIPNSWPYKEDLLKEIQVAKEKMEAMKLRHKEKRNDEIVSSTCTCIRLFA
jgi:hypothetical protein